MPTTSQSRGQEVCEKQSRRDCIDAGPPGTALLPRPLALCGERVPRRKDALLVKTVTSPTRYYMLYILPPPERDHSFIWGNTTPKRLETEGQAQSPLTNIPESKAKYYRRAIFMARGSYTPLILKEQDETPFNLCSKSMLKFYFKCFMIRDTES